MKKVFALALVFVLGLTLAACSTAPASSSASTPAASAPAASGSTAASGDADAIAAIQAKGKLTIGTEAQYAPFEFKDDKAQFAGCDIWLAQQIATELGVELEVVDMAFDGIIPAVMSGQVDMGIAAFTVTEERAKEIDFTDIYQRDQQLLIVKKGNEDLYATKESLAGLQVGAQKGTIQSLLIQSALPDSKLFELAKYPALALEVANGTIAGLVVDGAVGEGLVATNENIVVSNFEFSAEEANFGKAAVVAKGNDALVEVANKVIAKVVEDGSFKKAYDEAVALSKTLGI